MDDFFKQAAEEYLNALSNSLPQPENCRHSFGKRFEKRMRLLIAKTLHPVRTAMLRAAASFAAVLLLFGSVLAVDADARKAFLGWRNALTHIYSFPPAGKHTIPYRPSILWDGCQKDIVSRKFLTKRMVRLFSISMTMVTTSGSHIFTHPQIQIYIFSPATDMIQKMFLLTVCSARCIFRTMRQTAQNWYGRMRTERCSKSAGSAKKLYCCMPPKKFRKNNFFCVQNRSQKTLLCVEQIKGVNK